MKVLFSLLWLLNFSQMQHPVGDPVTAPPAAAQTSESIAQPENPPPVVRSTGTVVKYYRGQGIGQIKPQSSGTLITVLIKDVTGRRRIDVNTEVTYIESNDRKNGRRATAVEVVKP